MSTLTRLSEILAQLNEDERRVVLFIAERVFMGRERYAPMNLASDTRDFTHEAVEESADHAVYTSMLAACDANLRFALERERARTKRSLNRDTQPSAPWPSHEVTALFSGTSHDDDEWPPPLRMPDP